jgi:hypothetical protein
MQVHHHRKNYMHPCSLFNLLFILLAPLPLLFLLLVHR